ncbi:DUF927 domain-containing protein [Alkalihalobacillus deserti]|uniref:DUF927 domain-containing protein n=1 Tax=Alkalihalobacillus deserti TaxID=2879466 RepID=UPI001D154A13|nr:DUF927 domain-containing protein [Alkalihalobacillus deserti]
MEYFIGRTRADLLRQHGIDQELDSPQESRILELIRTAPVPFGAIVPDGWLLDETGLYERRFSDREEESEPKRVSYEPIVISEVYENITNNSEGLTVSWCIGNQWKSVSHSRDYFMVANKIIDLSNTGFPVNSNNAKNVIKFITDFLACNRNILPFKHYTEQLGWTSNKSGFLLGEHFISGEGDDISFLPSDIGEQQLVEGFDSKGDLETWLQLTRRLIGYPKVMIGVYASFASVLSSIFNVGSFIFEWNGETSKGKTISMKVAASVWGNPSTDQGGIIKKWNVTPVNIERTASLLKNLPLFLDDTKDLSRSNQISGLIYNLASGQGKGRGSIKGSQKTKYWNTITFSTGEQKITSFTKDGGTAGRVLPITGLPFDNDDMETACLVEGIEMDLLECHGQAGQKWIRYLLENRASWSEWKVYFNQMRLYFLQQANGNSVVGRLAKYMAMIDTAAMLFNDCFSEAYDFRSMLDTVWHEVVTENAEVDRPLEALKTVYSWMVANKHKFKNDDWSDSYGIWNHEGIWDEVYIHPHILEELLSSKGYDPSSIFESWNNRQWLITQKDRGWKKQKTVKGVKSDYIVIRREALES